MKIPYLVNKNGNFYWQPNKAMRAQGMRNIALGKDPAAAQAMARQLNAEYIQLQDPRQNTPRAQLGVGKATIDQVFAAYTTGRNFRKLQPITQRDYLQNHRTRISPWAGEIAIHLITRKMVQTWYDSQIDIADARGLSYSGANHAMRVLSILFNYALDQGLVTTNPAAKQRVQSVAPRTVRWSDDEITHLVTTADQMLMPSIGDAVMLAVYTAQRQGDIIAMRWLDYQDSRLSITQSKTGAKVDIPVIDVLQARLEAARTRAIIAQPNMVLHENTKTCYGADNFRHRFHKVRQQAAIVMPRITEKTFADLRDTAITKLAEAGCTAIEISGVSGHTLASVDNILKHYIVQGKRLADNALDKLQAHETANLEARNRQ